MTPLSSYLEYEAKVKKILKDKIQSELGTDCIICDLYKFKQYIFDLAVLDNRHNIVRIYEIKTPSSVKTNYNFIKALLREYKERTKADVFLAYLNERGQLHIESLEKLVVGKSENTSVQKTINNFPEFYEALRHICDIAIDKQYFFRGQSDQKPEPTPSIYRKNNIDKENNLYHEAIRRKPAEFTEYMSTFDNLVKMQHYELPTRLLDITSNPLVALYFACQEDDKKDGAVLVYSILKEQLEYFDSDAVCILSNLAKCPIEFNFDEQKDRLVHDIQKDMPSYDGDDLEDNALHKVFCVLPKLNNNRIICQDGAFFIFGMGKTKKEPATLPDQPSKIIIKAEAKKNILKELELLGIDEASLFPETDKVMKQIKQQFCD